MEDTIGARIELTQDIQRGKKGDRGVIGEKSDYIGIVLDSCPGHLIICHAQQPITNFCKIVEDERLVQKSLFGDES